jgi:hypothetical protein
MSIPAINMLKSVSLEQLAELLDNNSSFKGYTQGYLSEFHLRKQLLLLPGIISVEKIPDRNKKKGDFLVVHEKAKFTIELKSLSSRGIKEDLIHGGINGKVVIKGTDSQPVLDIEGKELYRTTCLERGQFDVLCVCTYSLEGKWDYYFMHSRYIPDATGQVNRMRSNISINTANTPCLYTDIFKVFPDLS